MDLQHKAVRVSVCGMTATGKSTFCERYLKNCNAQTVYVFDHQQNEFANRLGVEPITSFLQLDQAHCRQKFICFDPYPEFGGDLESGFSFFCRYVYERNINSQHTTLFFTDEMDMLQGYSVVNTDLRDLLVAGRRRKIDVLYICQQLNLIHNTLRNTLTELVIFRTNDARALAYPIDLGLNEDEIRDLPDCHFFHLDLKTNKISKGQLYDERANESTHDEVDEEFEQGDEAESGGMADAGE